MSQLIESNDRYGGHMKGIMTSTGTILVLFILLIIVLGGLMCF